MANRLLVAMETRQACKQDSTHTETVHLWLLTPQGRDHRASRGRSNPLMPTKATVSNLLTSLIRTTSACAIPPYLYVCAVPPYYHPTVCVCVLLHIKTLNGLVD